MRILPVAFGLLLIGSAYGLEVLAINEPVEAIDPYLYESEPYDEEIEPAYQFQINAPVLPVQSKASPGVVVKGRAPDYLSINMLVIGDDPQSRQWLKTHHKFLKQFQGIALVACVKTPDALAELEAISGLRLMAVNVDALMEIIHQSHYPLVIEKGAIWQ